MGEIRNENCPGAVNRTVLGEVVHFFLLSFLQSYPEINNSKTDVSFAVGYFFHFSE